MGLNEMEGTNEMTLPEYISSCREFDSMSVQQVWALLLKRGKIAKTATLQDVIDACAEAQRLFDIYLR